MYCTFTRKRESAIRSLLVSSPFVKLTTISLSLFSYHSLHHLPDSLEAFIDAETILHFTNFLQRSKYCKQKLLLLKILTSTPKKKIKLIPLSGVIVYSFFEEISLFLDKF